MARSLANLGIPNQPGVLGQPPVPGNTAIGVKGDVGPGFPGIAFPGRRAIGVYGTTSDPSGAGVLGENTAGGNAGQFSGNDGSVFAKVDVVLGSDCAEDFDIRLCANVEPGTVMALDERGYCRKAATLTTRKWPV